MSEEKVKISIHLLRRAYETALARSEATGTPLSVTVADAAARMLLALHRTDKEVELVQAVERVFFKLQKLETRQNREFVILKEMLGLGIRAYFNRTPQPGEAEHDAAILSGKVQFQQYLDALAKNLHRNESILVSIPEPAAPPAESDGSQEEPSEPGNPRVESTSEQYLNGQAVSSKPDSHPKKNTGDPATVHVASHPPVVHRNGRTPEIPALFPDTETDVRNHPQQSTNTPSQTGE